MEHCQVPSRCSWSLEDRHAQALRELTWWGEAGDKATLSPFPCWGLEEQCFELLILLKDGRSLLLLNDMQACQAWTCSEPPREGKEISSLNVLFLGMSYTLGRAISGGEEPIEEGTGKIKHCHLMGDMELCCKSWPLPWYLSLTREFGFNPILH